MQIGEEELLYEMAANRNCGNDEDSIRRWVESCVDQIRIKDKKIEIQLFEKRIIA